MDAVTTMEMETMDEMPMEPMEGEMAMMDEDAMWGPAPWGPEK